MKNNYPVNVLIVGGMQQNSELSWFLTARLVDVYFNGRLEEEVKKIEEEREKFLDVVQEDKNGIRRGTNQESYRLNSR